MDSNQSSNYAVFRVFNSLALMSVTISSMYAAIMVLVPATAEFNIGRGTGALPYTLFMIAFGLGNIFMGQMVDRYGIAKLALIGSIAMPLGLYLSSLAHSFWLFTGILAVVCGFLGSAFAFGPLIADISQWFNKRRGLAVAIVSSGSYVGGSIWPPVIQSWIDTGGWRYAFVNLALFCAVTMLPLSLTYFRKGGNPTQSENSNSESELNRPLGFSRPNLQRLLCCAGVGCCCAMAMPQIHIVPHVIDVGFTAKDGAYMLALMLGFGIFSRLFSGWISDLIGGLKTLILGSVLQMLVILSFLFVDTLIGLYLVSAAFGLSQGGIVPSYTIIIRQYFRSAEAGKRIGLIFVATTVGMALGGSIAGWLYDLTGSYTVSFLNAAAFNLMNLIIAAILLRRSFLAITSRSVDVAG
ncbi:MAG: MFS family permease [Gammaproteobacteria bacterium]|jgi:MFS family permease